MLEMILLIKTNTWNAYNPDPIPYDYVIHTIDICMLNFIYNRASNCVLILGQYLWMLFSLHSYYLQRHIPNFMEIMILIFSNPKFMFTCRQVPSRALGTRAPACCKICRTKLKSWC